MSDKKPTDRGVVDSIERLRLQRYMTKGPGAKRAKAAPAPLPSVDQLRAQVSKVGTKISKRKKKRTRR